MILLTILDKILRLFGSSEQQLRWRLMRRRRAQEARRAAQANRNQHLTYRHKVCDTCGRILDRDVRVCPYCDAPVSSWGAKLGEKVAQRLTPGTGALTSGLLVINGVIFFYLVVITGEIWRMPGHAAIGYGAKFGPLITAGEQWWRLFSANFLHVGGAIHLGFNLVSLATIGPVVEEWYGASRMVVIYLLTGVIAMLTSHLWEPVGVSGGASGAVLGLIGAGVIAGHLDGGMAGRQMRNSLLRWFVYVALIGLLIPGIDNAAHFGGFAAGVVLGLGLKRESRPGLVRTWSYRIMAVALAGACAWSLVEAYRFGRTMPPDVDEGDVRRAWLVCREATDGGDPAVAAETCDRYARLYVYEYPLATHLAAEWLRRAGREEDAERILAVLCAVQGWTDAGVPGDGFVDVARDLLDAQEGTVGVAAPPVPD